MSWPAFVVMVLAAAVTAQSHDPAAPSGERDSSSAQAAQERIAQLESRQQAGELDEEGKAELQLYREALTSLTAAQGSAKEKADFEAATARAPDELESIKAVLAEPPVEPVPQPPPDASLTQLADGLEGATAELSIARGALSALGAEADRRKTRRDKIAEEELAARQASDEVRVHLAGLPLADESPALTAARRAALGARAQAMQGRIDVLAAERKSYDATRDLLVAQRELSTRRITELEKLVAAWQELVSAERALDIQRQREAAALAAVKAHPLVAPIAEENLRLAERRDELRPRLVETRRRLEELHPDPEELQRQFDSLQQRVELVGLTSTVGMMLRKTRGALPAVSEHRRNIRKRQSEMADAEFERLSISDEYDSLVTNKERQVQTTMALLERDVPAAEREVIEIEVREQIDTKRQYLKSLDEDLTVYFNQLAALNVKELGLVELTGQIDEYIGERILWIRSTPPLRAADLPEAVAALGWMVSPSEWSSIVRSAVTRARAGWLYLVPAVIGLILVLTVRARLRARISRIADELSRPSTNTMGRTVETAAYSVLAAAAWPAVLWSAGAWLEGSGGTDGGQLAPALGGAGRATAILLFEILLIIEVCRPKGLGEAHFRWRQDNLRLARRHLRRLALTLVPVAFISATMYRQTNTAYETSLGRLAFIAGMVVLAIFAERMLRPVGGIPQAFLKRHRGGWIDRLRFAWYPLAIAIPFVLGLASLIGYHYTAVELTRQILQTALFGVLLALVYNVVLRWVFVAQRRLALEEVAKRRAAYEEKRARGEDTGDAPPPAEDEAIDVSAVSAQTRQLVRGVALFSVLIGVWLIWADALPAIGFLRGVELWHGGTVATAEGDAAVATMITLQDLLLAIVVLVVTIIIGKNIPGLLEISILQRLPLDRGSQFAISTLTRYAITIVGVIIAFSLIGLTWSKLQWIAAAVTVGLGFGLQEIFGNFVSGLIILFERPIRVGDTVTVGTVHGTVSKIRIRATTVIDWDRKEMVIPNKEFVMGSIVNWTLSDPILRVVVPVGVAYGSDTALAERLLLQAARENPFVLDEPPPNVVFSKFGDSSLEFNLRAFIPNIDQLFKVRHALHNSIDQAFRKAGIVIAFPQRDIHIHSVKGGAPLDELGQATKR